MKKILFFALISMFLMSFYSCKDDENTVPSSTEDPRLAKRQMHFTFYQYQNASEDSLVSGATLKMYKNFSDFNADTAVVLTGTSVDGKLVLPGEDDGAAYYYRANHTTYGEVSGSAINALFDDYFRVEF